MKAIATLDPALEADPKIIVAMAMFDAWSARDWDKVEVLFAEDGVLHSMMNEPVMGREAIGRGVRAWGAGATHCQLYIKHIGLIDGIVYAERVDEFVHNGHKCQLPTVGALQIEGGEIRYWREYYDRSTLLRGMGLEKDYTFGEMPA